MLYKYTATTLEGELKTGSIEASSVDIAISSLQARSLVITDIKSAKQSGSILENLGNLKFFNKVKTQRCRRSFPPIGHSFEAKIAVMDSLRLLTDRLIMQGLKKALRK